MEAIFAAGHRVGSPLAVALILKTPTERGRAGRVAFVAGKRVGGAVVRNRSKRVLREAALRMGAPWQGADVVLIARRGTADAPPAAIDNAVRSLLRRGGVR